jgi:hypothetical protein
MENIRRTLNGKEALTLLLYLPGKSGQVAEPIVGRTRIIKTMFLFEKEVRPQLKKKGIDFNIPEFEGYNFGPFSVDVLNDLDTLKTLGVIEINDEDEWDELDSLADLSHQEYDSGTSGDVERKRMDRYSLTSDGIRFCEAVLRPRFDLIQWSFLEEFKTRCNSVRLNALIRYVYTRYPEYTKSSLIRDRVLKFGTIKASP